MTELSGQVHSMGGLMVKPVSRDGKAEVLAGSRTLNPHPGAVTDAVFEGEDFFDARDLVQVKYEMVRKTDVEDMPVAAAGAAFGFSRQSLYTAKAALREQGLAGLVPARPGPKAGFGVGDEGHGDGRR